MVRSMTGFGRSEVTDGKRTISVEIKAVNHRYSEISVRMPHRYSFAEDTIKALVKNFAQRGKIDVSVSVDNASADDTEIKLNLELAKKYYDNLVTLKNEIPSLGGDITINMLAGLPDVLKSSGEVEDEESFVKLLTEAVNKAGEAFVAMREVEGAKLIEDILYRNDLIEKTVLEIEEHAPEVAQNYVVRMKENISALLENKVDIPEDRVLLEAAVFADKSNITEEIVRLKSHVSQLRKKLDNPAEPVGKALDFLVQEMNRESNTIGSKANDLSITNNVLILKAEIEKIREQIQNIE